MEMDLRREFFSAVLHGSPHVQDILQQRVEGSQSLITIKFKHTLRYDCPVSCI